LTRFNYDALLIAAVTPAFLAPNKSPNKSRVFFKTFPLSSFSPSLTLGTRAANPAGTARTRAIAHRVSS
jgi:hypothetical protein